MVNPTDTSNADQFSLRWNNFHSNLSSGFHDLLEEEDLVDVTLACEGQFVQAHKIVLSVCSPYFKALFKANPCKHPIVILKDVRHRDLMSIIQFMYLGEVNVRQDELTFFLKTAEMLKVKGLTEDDKAKSSSKDPVSDDPPLERPHGANQQTKSSAPSEPVSAPPTKRFRRDQTQTSSSGGAQGTSSQGGTSQGGTTAPPPLVSHRPAPPDSPALSGDSSLMDASALEFVAAQSSKAPKMEPVDTGDDLDREECIDDDDNLGEVVMGGEEYKALLQESGRDDGGGGSHHHSMDMGGGSVVMVGDSTVTVSGGGGGTSHSVSQPPPLTPATTVTSSGVSIFPSSSGSSQEALSQDYSHGGFLAAHYIRPFVCRICGFVTDSRRVFSRHQWDNHASRKVSELVRMVK